MLEPLYIEATDYSPEVCLNQIDNIFSISGKSIVEDAYDFYMPLIYWFIKYKKNPNKITTLVLDFDYLNSASTRKLLSIIVELEKMKSQNHIVKVVWLYEDADDIMQERGEELMCIFDIDFVLQKKEIAIE